MEKPILERTDPIDFTFIAGIAECSRCKHRKSPHWRVTTAFDYGYLPAFTADLKDAVLLPVGNAIWDDLKKEVDDFCFRVSLSPAYHLDFFDRVMAMTLDSASENRSWYLWCQTPCPKCGWQRSYYGGDEDPPRHWDLLIHYGTQNHWAQMPRRDRTSVIETVLKDYKEWWNWINPQTGERVQRRTR